MSPFAAITIALLIAHACGDFLLQRQGVIAGKRARAWVAYLEHGAIHMAALILAFALFAPLPLTTWSVVTAFSVIVLSHLLSDWVKETTRPGGGPWLGVAPFLLDQMFHISVIVIVAAWLAGVGEVVPALVEHWRGARDTFGILLAGYLLVVVGAGYLNALLLRNLAPGEPTVPGNAAPTGADSGVGNAGLYIGWLERFLMLTAVLLESPAALGLILAAKSIFRFDDIRKGRASTEYFLIGTLVSVSEAVAGGLLMRWLLVQL
jgi:hypothetical protein